MAEYIIVTMTLTGRQANQIEIVTAAGVRREGLVQASPGQEKAAFAAVVQAKLREGFAPCPGFGAEGLVHEGASMHQAMVKG